MKKYKLKKDTFLAKKGELFREVNESGAVYLQRIEPDGSDLFTKIAKAPIIDFDEWFEEVKEFREFMPRHSEQYKCINEDGVVVSYYNDEDGVDSFNFSIGNAYPLDTPDEVIIKEQKLIPQAMHRLKMAAKKAWFEFNGSEGPDWGDDTRYKSSICYDHDDQAVVPYPTRIYQGIGVVYFPTEESCQAYIDNNQDDLKLLFGVE